MNFSEVLDNAVANFPDKVVYRFVNRDGSIDSLTYREFYERTIALAAQLQAGGSVQGERAILLYPPGIDYIVAFFACLYCGIIAVPAYPPSGSKLRRNFSRLKTILSDCSAKFILSDRNVSDIIRKFSAKYKYLDWVSNLPGIDSIFNTPLFSRVTWINTTLAVKSSNLSAMAYKRPNIKGSDIAFLQYTSGSTNKPKGVMVAHDNLYSNSELIQKNCDFNPDTIGVSWLPPYHDMGLIGGILQTVYSQFSIVMMSPLKFIFEPSIWLKTISDFQATHSGGPDFGFSLCAEKITPEEIATLDLSSWRVAFTGAEPIRFETLDRFSRVFAPAGFKLNHFFPCYGLAESTLMVSASKIDNPPLYLDVDSSQLEEGKLIPPKDLAMKKTLVGCGSLFYDLKVKIVDPDTHVEMPPDKIGEIWVSGGSVALGYWDKPKKSKEIFQGKIKGSKDADKYLATGDLGFLHNGELFVTGRLKDIIIINGRNYYPNDIEITAEMAHECVRKSCCAAFGVNEEGEEKLVIVCEVDKAESKAEEIKARIKSEVSETDGILPYKILLIEKGSIPKTTSGKIQRRKTKKDYQKGRLKIIKTQSTSSISFNISKLYENTRQLESLIAKKIGSSGLGFNRQRQEDKVIAVLREALAEQTGIAQAEINAVKPFSELGLSSIQGVEIIAKINKEQGWDLDPVDLFNYPNALALAKHIVKTQQKPQILSDQMRYLLNASPINDRIKNNPSLNGLRSGLSSGFGAGNDEKSGRLGSKKKSILRLASQKKQGIYVSGMACRFPGSKDYRSFWENLSRGVNSIHSPEADRFKSAGVARQYPFKAGYINEVKSFDAPFFAISRKEAKFIDPQHRLLLECIYHAIEDSGLQPSLLKGSNTGVYIGISSTDYAALFSQDVDNVSPYSAIGNAHSMAAGRIAYYFDLKGPCIAIDTACSSSLVALTQAVQDLRSGKCSQAVVAGVNCLLDPRLFKAFANAGMLSPASQCKTFSDDADGYVRGEGVGAVFLTKDMVAGVEPHCEIVGVATNQDGLSNGITAPNGMAQVAVIQDALADASLSIDDINHLEAHGTGTHLGDPVEYKSIAEVFSGRKSPLYLSSVKTSIGHLEAAAGMAGLIKSILMVKNSLIPPHQNFTTLNSNIKPAEFIQIPRKSTRVENSAGMTAGVSSFGFSGSNAHIIIRAVEESSKGSHSPRNTAGQDDGVSWPGIPFILGYGSLASRKGLLKSILDQLHTGNHPEAVAYELSHRKEHKFLECFYARNHQALLKRLEQEIQLSDSQIVNSPKNGISLKSQQFVNTALGLGSDVRQKKIAFVFTGQGSEYPHMARKLYQQLPLFQSDFKTINHTFKAHFTSGEKQYCLEEIITSHADLSKLPNYVLQPLIFAVGLATVKLFEKSGITPSYVAGHSLGEYTAACYSGMLSLSQAVELLVIRGRCMDKAIAQLGDAGKMLSIFLDAKSVASLLESGKFALDIAAENSENLTVISGSTKECNRFVDIVLDPRQIDYRILETKACFHSRHLKGASEDFFGKIKPRAAKSKYRIYSSVTGNTLEPSDIKADYLAKQIHRPVLYGKMINQILLDGAEGFVEIGASPHLTQIAQHAEKVLSQGNTSFKAVPWVATLSAKRDDIHSLFLAATHLMSLGLNIAPHRQWLGGGYNRNPRLMSYPFEKRDYWIDEQYAAKVKPVEDQKASLPNEKKPNLSANSEIKENSMADMPNENTLSGLDAIEGYLIETLAQVLEVSADSIERTVNLLQLGADSLMLLETLQKIEDKYELKIPVNSIFESLSTLDRMAQYIFENSKVAQRVGQGVSEEMSSSGNLQVGTQLMSFQPSFGENSGSGSLQELFNSQIAIMQRQLQLLSMQPGGGMGEGSPKVSTNSNIAQNKPKTPAPPKTGDSSNDAMASEKDRFNAFDINQQYVSQYTPQQQQYIDSLIEKVAIKCPSSKGITQRYRMNMADNRVSAGFKPPFKDLLVPIMSDSAEGCRVKDIDGNEYLDITMGFGVHLFGHNPQFIQDRVAEQLKKGCPVGPQSPLAGPVAEKICKLTGHQRVAYTNSGTEAVMTAVRLARAAKSKPKIVIFSGSYHGTFDGFLARASSNDFGQPIPVAPGVTENSVADTYVLPYLKESSLKFIREHAGEIAAVLVEPIQSRYPGAQPKAFLEKLRLITRDKNICFIWDEMITGFRIAAGGAAEYFNITPDMSCYGKIIGAGMPIGIVAGDAQYLDVIDGGHWSYGDDSYPKVGQTFFAGTFSKHPAMLAGSNALCDFLLENGREFYYNLNQKSEKFVLGMNDFFQAEGIGIRFDQFGSLFRFHFSGNLDILFYLMMYKGIFIWEGRNCFISDAHTDKDLEELARIMKECVLELIDAGFIQRSKGFEVSESRLPQQGRMAMTASQWRFASLHKISTQAALAANVVLAVEVGGVINKRVFNAAVNACLGGVPSVYRQFDWMSGEYVDGYYGSGQNAENSVAKEYSVAFHDFSSLDEKEYEVEFRRLMMSLSESRFDLLEKGPHIQIAACKIPGNKSVLGFAAHHMCMDGYSLYLFFKLISQFYESKLFGAKAPEVEVFELSKHKLAGPQADYSENDFAFIPYQDLSDSIDYNRSAFDFSGCRLDHSTASNAMVKIKEVAKSHAVTKNMLVLTATRAFFHKMFNVSTIDFLIPVIGHEFGKETQIDDLIDLKLYRSEIGDESAVILSTSQGISPAIWNKLLGETKAMISKVLVGPSLSIDSLNAMRKAQGSGKLLLSYNYEPLADLPKFAGKKIKMLCHDIVATEFDIILNFMERSNEMKLSVDCLAGLKAFASDKMIPGIFAEIESLCSQVSSELPSQVNA